MKSYQITAFGEPLVEVEAPTPQPAGKQVLLRVKAAGVCHSDLHIWEGSYDMGEGKPKMRFEERGIKPPITLGHETVGEVVAVGEEVVDVHPGQVLLVYPWIGCDACTACKRGDYHMCLTPSYTGVQRPGGYADHIMVPDEKFLIDIDGIDPAVAAPYACSGITAYGALKKLGDALERPVLMFGAGGLGLMALRLLSRMESRGAIVLDINAQKRAAALELGALAALDPSDPDIAAQIAQVAGGPVLGAIDFVGAPQTAQLGFDSITKGGKLVMVGLFGGGAPWSLPLLPVRVITIQGSYVGSLAETKELIDLVRSAHVEPIPITRVPLHQADRALQDLRNGKLVGRAVLVPDES